LQIPHEDFDDPAHSAEFPKYLKQETGPLGWALQFNGL